MNSYDYRLAPFCMLVPVDLGAALDSAAGSSLKWHPFLVLVLVLDHLLGSIAQWSIYATEGSKTYAPLRVGSKTRHRRYCTEDSQNHNDVRTPIRPIPPEKIAMTICLTSVRARPSRRR